MTSKIQNIIDTNKLEITKTEMDLINEEFDTKRNSKNVKLKAKDWVKLGRPNLWEKVERLEMIDGNAVNVFRCYPKHKIIAIISGSRWFKKTRVIHFEKRVIVVPGLNIVLADGDYYGMRGFIFTTGKQYNSTHSLLQPEDFSYTTNYVLSIIVYYMTFTNRFSKFQCNVTESHQQRAKLPILVLQSHGFFNETDETRDLNDSSFKTAGLDHHEHAKNGYGSGNCFHINPICKQAYMNLCAVLDDIEHSYKAAIRKNDNKPLPIANSSTTMPQTSNGYKCLYPAGTVFGELLQMFEKKFDISLAIGFKVPYFEAMQCHIEVLQKHGLFNDKRPHAVRSSFHSFVNNYPHPIDDRAEFDSGFRTAAIEYRNAYKCLTAFFNEIIVKSITTKHQTSKLNSNLNQQRQRNLGIEKFDTSIDPLKLRRSLIEHITNLTFRVCHVYGAYALMRLMQSDPIIGHKLEDLATSELIEVGKKLTVYLDINDIPPIHSMKF